MLLSDMQQMGSLKATQLLREVPMDTITILHPNLKWHYFEVYWKGKQLHRGHEGGFPTNDLYGALACHVEKVLRDFCEQVIKVDLSIQLYQLDARELPKFFDDFDFDRVDVSNMMDRGCLAVETVLESFGPHELQGEVGVNTGRLWLKKKNIFCPVTSECQATWNCVISETNASARGIHDQTFNRLEGIVQKH
jgi:hypothetical protein